MEKNDEHDYPQINSTDISNLSNEKSNYFFKRKQCSLKRSGSQNGFLFSFHYNMVSKMFLIEFIAFREN